MTTSTPMPSNACDCHVHIYEDRYPLAASATFKPPPAPVSAYREVQGELGLERVVLVQPTGYGYDNSCLLDAFQQFGGTARGVAVVPQDVSDSELQRLHDGGVRGVRFMLLAGAGGLLPWDALEPMAARIAPLGWHIDLQLDGRDLPQHQAMIDRLPCKVVIDHTGKFIEPVPIEDASFKALQSVLERDGRWIKLSAPYETSKVGPPGYDDVSTMARALVASHPDRCLWASNWPHPNRNPRPDDVEMLRLLSDWAPDQGVREGILVENPVDVYGW